MKQYECKTAQKGFAAGRACVVRSGKTGEYLRGEPAAEIARLEKAAAEMSRKLNDGKEKDSSADSSLIDAEILILNGEEFLGEARRRILEENQSAPEAVLQTTQRLCRMFEENGTDYVRERCEDIRGLASGLNSLIMGDVSYVLTEPCILVGTELSPGEIMMAGTEYIRGILTGTGSPTSHVSVIAGNLGIPYLYEVENILEKVKNQDYLILDSDKNQVWVDPPDTTIREAEARQIAIEEERAKQQAFSAGRVTHTAVCANISRAEEADGLIQAGADGIGLFRSEFLFLNRFEVPSEEEQYEAYRHAAEAMNGRATVIRTMDIGSDKQARWLAMPKEINPALGLRGLRVSLKHRELFRTQLRSLLRASVYGNIRIMIPMVTSVWEIEETEKEIRKAAEELNRKGIPYKIPELGVMIETPASVMIAPELARKARFFCIGTNDLTQYTLAVDREAHGLDEYFDPLHDAVLRMISLTVEAAHKNNIPVAVCGELAGDLNAVEHLIRQGVDELSVSASKLFAVRNLAADIEEKLEKEKKQKKTEGICSPTDGELFPMEEIPDPVFSGGVLGECIGILPSDGKIYAPLTGKVTTVAAAKHAVSFSKDETEILVHFGLNTVQMNGEGFRVHVREGDMVRQGQLVMEADLDLIRSRGYNPMVVVVRIK